MLALAVMRTPLQNLDKGVDPNSPDEYGITRLHLVCAAGFTAIAKLLLAHGADVKCVDNHGRTARDCARDMGHYALAEIVAAAAESKRRKDKNKQ
jgi:ankyrin repeat protein